MSNKKRVTWAAAILAAVLFLAAALAAGWFYENARFGAAAKSVESRMASENDVLENLNGQLQQYAGRVTEMLSKKDKLIVIDPGHQGKGNYDKEPVGPGASTMKAKVSSGTAGRTTGIPEYEVTLDVSFFLRDELESRGYQVIMTRETHDINISNSERAAIANDNEADAFVRIHCNGSENSAVTGAMTICMTPGNIYNGELHEESYRLSDEILTHMCEETGVKRQKIWETDTMSGINWCKVPVTIVEMGYMTNKEEELKLVDTDYQKKMAKAIADGIEAFLDSGE